MKFKDYYAVLGIARDADAGTIKKAYRKLAREHHPDMSKAAGAELRFKEIGETLGPVATADQLTAVIPLDDITGGVAAVFNVPLTAIAANRTIPPPLAPRT